ncbi:cysteine desulfurase [Anaeromyxobacter sp. Fw109-5]|uniref:cysteine desulfurase n=1 Tax=Anaeromyxobacter sp. (strain Fw109-5) TaxID=404589 RepID=UPI0000ED7F89|nr:cysteine desulfurase [Anaeromyxobacter sp. Fw109-5]ABS25115.1 cysteine desulfurase, SufS subfamily [Anaeromyxobacter sp. Fw109-5]
MMGAIGERRIEAGATRRTGSAFDPARVREDFPILRQRVHGRPLVYLDNAATTQKPRAVIDAVSRYYEEDNANVHRGVHLLSERATRLHEDARARVARFLGAPDPREVIFVRGTTEAVNLVAQTFGRTRVGAGDEVLVTELEHHSNIVPWQMLCQEKGARLRVVPVTDAGDLDLDALEALLGPRTRLLSVTQLSNALGTVTPLAEIVARAHAKGIPVFVDGAQGAPHLGFDVVSSGADFYAFSGHKLYGPTGIGVLWGRREHLEAMPPWQGGGDMILSVTFEKTVYNALPFKFEAGTPDISGAVGLAAAIDYVDALGLEAISAHEAALLARAVEALSQEQDVRLVGAPSVRAGAISFLVGDVHPHDVGTVLDRHGVAVRAGHHCAQPLMHRLGLPATARASFGLYNTSEDVDALVRGIRAVREMFA